MGFLRGCYNNTKNQSYECEQVSRQAYLRFQLGLGETELQRDRETQKQSGMETKRRRHKETQKQREIETKRHRNREAQKQRDIETKRHRNKETQRQS